MNKTETLCVHKRESRCRASSAAPRALLDACCWFGVSNIYLARDLSAETRFPPTSILHFTRYIFCSRDPRGRATFGFSPPHERGARFRLSVSPITHALQSSWPAK